MNPLDIHNHFKPRVEVKVNPEIDWNDFANIDQFEKLLQPRLDNAGRLASEWERSVLLDALRLGCWRIWLVQTTIWGENRVDTYTKVFPPWEIKKAQALAKGLGEHILGLNLKRWLLMEDDEFVRESGSSPNFDVMVEMRRIMAKRCQRKVRRKMRK
jgi:hypothetical protein